MRRWWAPTAAAAVCSVVFIGVMVFGHVRYPAFASLAAGPNGLQGDIAVIVDDRHDGERCLEVVAAATGEPRQLRCTYRWHELTGWSEDGLVIVSVSEARAQRILYLDPQTGAVLRRGFGTAPLTDQTTERVEPGLYTDGPDGVARIVEESLDGEQEVVFSVSGPRSYRFRKASWSPDRRWVLAVDSEDRLVVVDPRGSVAWLVAEDVQAASWYMEGHASAARVGW